MLNNFFSVNTETRNDADVSLQTNYEKTMGETSEQRKKVLKEKERLSELKPKLITEFSRKYCEKKQFKKFNACMIY